VDHEAAVSPYRKPRRQPKTSHVPAWCEHILWVIERGFPAALMVLLSALAVLAAGGCLNSEQLAAKAPIEAQARVADGIAVAANAALPMLVEHYRQEGYAALQGVKDRGGNVDDANKAIGIVKDRWRPIWNAWASLAIAQNGWASVLESGADPTKAIAELKNAYCELMAVWPNDIPAIPLAPLRCPS
jgi:hypothetical protein